MNWADFRRAALRASAFVALGGVSPADAIEAAAQASALMQAANDSLSHTPPTSWKCYTALGATGSATSNLYGGFGNGLSLMSDGYSASRIARELEIDLDEMRRIEIALIDKFEASNRFQAIAKALVAGVVLN